MFAVTCCCSIPAYSTQTQIWETSSFEEFSRGEVDNVSLTNTGEVLLAPQIEPVLALKGQDLFVWALAEDAQGNLYAGTGEQGKIFKITPDGKTSPFFDSPEIGIMSLAVDAAGNVYAGTAPDGLIYKITPEGSPTTLFSTGEHYVWTLAFDANNVLYAGTGGSGKIFEIQPDGTGKVLYDSPQTHIMALLYDPKGWLYAGTEGKGVTYKVGLDGRAFTLYSAEEEEIHALARDSQGNLYVSAISNEFYPKAQPAPAAPTEQQPPNPKEKRLKKSSIYQISAAGTVRKILELPETLIYALCVDANDQLLVGTDEKGMIYRVFSNGEYHQVLSLKKGSILALLREPSGRIYAGTGDTGALYRLSAELAKQGSYLAPARDVKTTAAWGKIFWRGTPGQIALMTRTGNTPVPDDTWSPWSEELRNQEGSALPNPPARFVQWKAILTSQEPPNPVLEEVSVAYLPHNLPPEIPQVAVYAGAADGQPAEPNAASDAVPVPARKPDARPQKAEPKPPKQIPPGYVAIIWDAKDPNNDKLDYTISLRGAPETRWQLIEEDVENPPYLLDATTLPDGEYYVKITASDSPANPPDNALTAEKVSARFEIDNTPPEVSIALNQKQGLKVALITVVVQDRFSRLQAAEYAVDGGEWISVFPDDGVTDSREEKYSIALPDLTPEEHVLAFKATDAQNNTGAAKFVLPARAEEEKKTGK